MMEFEYTVKVKLESSEWQGFDATEQKIRAAAMGGAKELCGMVFEWYENQWLGGHKNFRHKGREVGTFKTTFGEIKFNRLRVIQRGKNIFPLDAWVGIISKDRCSPGLKQDVVRETVHRSFRKSAISIERTTLSSVSPMAAWRITQQEGAAQRRKIQQSIPAQFPPPTIPRITDTPIFENPGTINTKCPVLSIEIDATYCRNQAKLGLKHEIKLATMYTGKEVSGKKSKRWKLLNKTVFTQRKGETLESFFGRLSWIARAIYGADERSIVIVRGDGDTWIRRFKDDHFPKAIHFLDHWHVKKKMRLAFGEFALEFMMPYIHARDPKGLLKHIQETYLDNPLRLFPKQLQAMQDYYAYIKNNLDGLLHSGIPKEIKCQYPGMFLRGSGVIERNIDLVIGERCKLKRMRWSRDGLDNILALRENQINRDNGSPLLEAMAS